MKYETANEQVVCEGLHPIVRQFALTQLAEESFQWQVVQWLISVLQHDRMNGLATLHNSHFKISADNMPTPP